MRAVAFLRGINVGGKGLVKMAALADAFCKMGLSDVKTFIASGNVLFTTDATDMQALAAEIEECLVSQLSLSTRVLIRTEDELRELVDSDPFQRFAEIQTSAYYVTFYIQPPSVENLLPWTSHLGDYEVFELRGLELFSVSREIDGKRNVPTLPKGEISKLPSTTRNWNTVCKILDLMIAT